ncbi:MAG: aminoglycoside 6-adenylyltransferase, partial [Spirochaetaceae bacterium]|nr:aminoglycoside 6-adenylyltransferase [Spirochaetaceae bacterium]
MRSEIEMLDLILDTAKGDERVRAVVMNGSRADPEAPRDILQDFDIVYLVVDVG